VSIDYIGRRHEKCFPIAVNVTEWQPGSPQGKTNRQAMDQGKEEYVNVG
jgi:hypothetical protein